MKNIIKIMNKELLRVLKSKRMMLSLLLPGVFIFLMYSVLGDVMQNQALTDEEKAKTDTYIVYSVNTPEYLSELISEVMEYNLSYREVTNEEVQSKKNLLKTNEADLVLVFGGDWDYETLILDNSAKPMVNIYYNPYDDKSSYAFNRILTPALNMLKEQVLFEKNIDTEVFTGVSETVFDENKAEGDLIAMIVPMLIIVFLFSGCIAVTPESIAGEKERGTIATLLATPVKRGEIAIGKIAALSILAVISGASSFIGLMASLPKLLGTSGIFSIYGFGEIFLLFLIILSTVLVIVGAMAIVSSFSKNIKEATMIATPLLMLGVIVGMLNMFLNVPASFLFYLIPLYNASASIASVLTFEVSLVNLAVTVVSNIIYVVAFVWLLTKIFNNEKIMFSK